MIFLIMRQLYEISTIRKTIFHKEVNEEFLESNSDPSDVEDITELFFLKASTNNDLLAGNTFNELD